MEQRNFILFLLVAFCLWAGANYLTVRLYPPQPSKAVAQPEGADKITGASQPAKAAAGPSAKSGGTKVSLKAGASAKNAPESKIKIKTDKLEVEISNYGAGITSWKLLPFKEWEFPDPLPEDYAWKKWLPLVFDKPGRSVAVEMIPSSYTARVDLRQYAVVDLPGEDLGRRPWTLKFAEDSSATYVLELKDKGLRLTKTLQFENGSFQALVKLKVQNTLQEQNSVSGLSLDWGPNVGQVNTEDAANLINAVVLTSAKKESTGSKQANEVFVYPGAPRWAAVKNHYFAALFVPMGGAWNAGHSAREFNGCLRAGLAADLTLPAAGEAELSAKLYAGPQDYGLLQSLGSKMEKVVDFGIFSWLAIPMLKVLQWLHSIIPNYGVAIILLTILVRLLMWYPTHKGQTSMKHYQKAMVQLQPRLETLKKIYKDDAQKLNSETMKLYKEAGVNPFGGCLPMLVQLPIFVALYSSLNNAFELRGAPFFWVWNDLSHRDPTYLLYLGMGASMFLQQKITPAPQSSPEMAQQQKMMLYLMPVMFTGMSVIWGWPTGLLLYWAASNFLSIAQQLYVNRTVE